MIFMKILPEMYLWTSKVIRIRIHVQDFFNGRFTITEQNHTRQQRMVCFTRLCSLIIALCDQVPWWWSVLCLRTCTGRLSSIQPHICTVLTIIYNNKKLS